MQNFRELKHPANDTKILIQHVMLELKLWCTVYIEMMFHLNCTLKGTYIFLKSCIKRKDHYYMGMAIYTVHVFMASQLIHCTCIFVLIYHNYVELKKLIFFLIHSHHTVLLLMIQDLLQVFFLILYLYMSSICMCKYMHIDILCFVFNNRSRCYSIVMKIVLLVCCNDIVIICSYSEAFWTSTHKKHTQIRPCSALSTISTVLDSTTGSWGEKAQPAAMERSRTNVGTWSGHRKGQFHLY